MTALIWHGWRDGTWEEGGDTHVVMREEGSDLYVNLPLFLDEVNHSETGFEWGYWGSGPAQLAYAILRTYCQIVLHDDTQDIPRQHYQKFKEDIVSHKFGRQGEWVLTSYDVADWLKGEETT